MKVMHFIPDLAAVAQSHSLKYKIAVIGKMADDADTCVLTANSDGVTIDKAVIQTYSTARAAVTGNKKLFAKMLARYSPDIVHIHACWNYAAYRLLRECGKKGIPTIVTIDRKLDRWHFDHRYWLRKLPKWLSFQRKMLSQAGAVHLVCAQEMANAQAIGIHPNLKGGHAVSARCVLIENCDTTRGVTSSDVCAKLLALYQKVTDSVPFQRMTAEDLQAEDTLLHIGASEVNAPTTPPVGELILPSLERVSPPLGELEGASAWRRILLHSKDEGILDYVLAGAKAVGIAVPDIDPTQIDRFAIPSDLQSDAKDDTAAIARNSKISKLKADKNLPQAECDLCCLLVAVMVKIRNGSIHRADLVELYRAMRFNNYDEDLVARKVNNLRMGKKTARLFAILKERYGLGEGYMFAEPLDDRKTTRLKLKLSKSRIQ